MPADRTVDAVERMRLALYAVGILLIIQPLGDLVANVWPPHFTTVEWRYGVMGLLSGFTLTPMLGLVMILAVAAIVHDQAVLKVVGWLGIIAGAFLIIMTVFFALEIIQFRVRVPVENRGQYDIGSWKSVAKHLTAGPVLIMLGRAGLRAGRPGG